MISPVGILQTVNFLDQLAVGLLVPQIPAQARQLGCSHLVVGLIGALYAGFQLLSRPLVGALSDLNGKRAVMEWSLIATSLMVFLIGLPGCATLFIVINSLIGITKHTPELIKSLTPHYTEDQNYVHSCPILKSSYNAGLMIGPIISGSIVYMFPDRGFGIVAVLVSVLLAVSAGLIKQLPKGINKESEEDNKKHDNTRSISFHELSIAVANNAKHSIETAIDNFFQIDWNVHSNLFLTTFLMSLGAGIYLSNYVLFLKVKFEASSFTTGYTIAFLCFLSTLTSNTDKLTTCKDYAQRYFQAGMIFTVSLIALSVANSICVYVSFMIPLAISITVGRLINVKLVLSKAEEDQQNAFLNMATTIIAVCGVLSPIVTGIIAQIFGVLSVIYVAIVLTFIATVRSYKAVSEGAQKEGIKGEEDKKTE